jgi:hypothetical protein
MAADGLDVLAVGGEALDVVADVIDDVDGPVGPDVEVDRLEELAVRGAIAPELAHEVALRRERPAGALGVESSRRRQDRSRTDAAARGRDGCDRAVKSPSAAPGRPSGPTRP